MNEFLPLQAHNTTRGPRVSVLMPVFNTVAYLIDALSSVGGQTFSDFELIVIDDGSTDGSRKMLELFAEKEPRMQLVVRKNRGLIATRNELLGAARSALVSWMDSDDVALPDRLARQLAAFAGDPKLVCVGSAVQCIDPEGNYLNVERYPLTHQEILVEQQKGGAMRFATTMMRRDMALQVGGFREPFRIGEDFDLLLRLSEVGKMANLPDILYLYRQHVSSVCVTVGPQWTSYRDHILELARERQIKGRDRLQNGDTLLINPGTTFNRKHYEGQVYATWARYALRNENIPLALKYATAAILKQPLAVIGWKVALRTLLRLRPMVFAETAIRRLFSLVASRF